MRISRIFAAVVLAAFMVLAAPFHGHADQVLVGIGFSIPPYVIMDSDSGVEVDIIREAFRVMGYDAQFVYLPNLRLPVAFADNSVDCIVSNAAYDLAADSEVPAYYSDITISFQNYAVSLKGNGLVIDDVKDLADKSVLGFNNAVKYLGPEYAAMAADNPKYAELADQALQVRMLYSGRIEVVVSDKRIFFYWRNQLARSSVSDAVALDQNVVFHPIFPSAPRHVGFRNMKLRNLFNEGLERVRETGFMEAVEKKYAGIEAGH